MKKIICVFCFVCSLLMFVSCEKECVHQHTFSRKTNEITATCTEYASWIEETVCSDCGEILSTEQCYGNEKGEHQQPFIVRKTNEISATCTEYASWIEETVCSDCGEILSTEQCYGYEKAEHSTYMGRCLYCDYVDRYYEYYCLEYYEQLVFDALLINIWDTFSNPSDVRLQAATGFDSSYTWIYLKIDYTWYQLFVKDFYGSFGINYKKGHIYKCSGSYTPKTEISVEDINKALDFYWNY